MFAFFRKRRFRYKKKEKETAIQLITQQFGEIHRILPEMVWPDLRVDIAVIAPAPEHDYYTLVTLGMGAYRMKRCPAGIPNRLELAIRLPKDWDLESNREIWLWPVRWMRILARMPLQQDTRFEHGHTVDAGRNLADNTAFHGFALHSPGPKQQTSPLSGKDRLGILCMLPIYREERRYACARGTEKLFDRLDNTVLFGPADRKRKNSCI